MTDGALLLSEFVKSLRYTLCVSSKTFFMDREIWKFVIISRPFQVLLNEVATWARQHQTGEEEGLINGLGL